MDLKVMGPLFQGPPKQGSSINGEHLLRESRLNLKPVLTTGV